MQRLLLTTVCRPIGPAQGDAPSVGYELLYGQVTRAQGVFSPRATHVQYGLEYIANNVDAPTTVLQYPSRRQLIRELKKGYDYIGIAFIMATFHHLKRIVALVRKHSPQTKIVLGGYGTIMSDEELAPYSDHICREEGVAYTRRLLGEPEKKMPYDHPTVISKLKVFSIPSSRTGMVFAGLGCANGCDFCCTSHFFKRRHIRLLPTGKDIFDVLCRYQSEHGVEQFTILDEDFLLNKKRAMELRACCVRENRTFSIFAFASVRALNQYTPKELLEMGVDGLWIGYEGTRAGYDKQKGGKQPAELFPELRRHGILILASMIVGFDYQDQEVTAAELRGLLRLRPTLAQFLIYGPTPGTPFYDRVIKEGRMRPEVFSDPDNYRREATGFRSMVTHPKMSAEEIEGLQRWCFERDYQSLGPSMFRSIREWLSGFENLRASSSVMLRRKALRFGREVRRAYPLFLAGRIFAPNKRIRRWLKAFEKRAHRDLGAPSLWEQALSFAAVGAAAWTQFTLQFDYFQHPRLPIVRHRWEGLSEKFMRLWGEVRDGGRAAELKVLFQRRQAEGFSWLRLEGAMDEKNMKQLKRRLKASLKNGRERFEVSLEHIQYVDRKGLTMFYKVFRKYRRSMRLQLPERLPVKAPELSRVLRYFTRCAGLGSAPS